MICLDQITDPKQLTKAHLFNSMDRDTRVLPRGLVVVSAADADWVALVTRCVLPGDGRVVCIVMRWDFAASLTVPLCAGCRIKESPLDSGAQRPPRWPFTNPGPAPPFGQPPRVPHSVGGGPPDLSVSVVPWELQARDAAAVKQRYLVDAFTVISTMNLVNGPSLRDRLGRHPDLPRVRGFLGRRYLDRCLVARAGQVLAGSVAVEFASEPPRLPRRVWREHLRRAGPGSLRRQSASLGRWRAVDY